MCGIAGIVAPELPPSERLALVRAMVARLRHRGPSGEAIWDDGECALGIARLAIVAPNQPASVLANERGDVRGVVNGEIYNHLALLGELRARGHDIAAGSRHRAAAAPVRGARRGFPAGHRRHVRGRALGPARTRG